MGGTGGTSITVTPSFLTVAFQFGFIFVCTFLSLSPKATKCFLIGLDIQIKHYSTSPPGTSVQLKILNRQLTTPAETDVSPGFIFLFMLSKFQTFVFQLIFGMIFRKQQNMGRRSTHVDIPTLDSDRHAAASSLKGHGTSLSDHMMTCSSPKPITAQLYVTAFSTGPGSVRHCILFQNHQRLLTNVWHFTLDLYSLFLEQRELL